MSSESDDYFQSTYQRPTRNKKQGKASMSNGTTLKKPLANPASTAVSAAPFRIVSGVQSAQRYLKIMLYAKFGHGKTVLAAQAVDVPETIYDMGDVLFVNVEGGTHSIVGSRAVKNYKHIDVVPEEGTVPSFEMFDAIYRMLLAYCQARDDDDSDRLERMAQRYEFPALAKRNYKTVIIDSISELNAISLQRAFGENPNDLLNLSDSDDTRRDYGRNRQSMTKVLRAFRNLPMNVIVTCGADWERNTEDRDTKPKYYPRLTGALSQEVQGYWDVVGFLYSPGRDEGATEEDAQISSRLYLQPGKFHDAKNRLAGRDIRYIDNPSMTKLIALLTTGSMPDNSTATNSMKSGKVEAVREKQIEKEKRPIR